MSQEESLSTATMLPEEPIPVDPETLVTNYADSLITELFDDVDKILDGDEAALAAVEAAPEPPSTALAPIVDIAATADPPAAATDLAPLGSEIDFFKPEDVQAASPPAKTGAGKLFDRILLSITALSLLGIGGLLWFNQQGGQWLGRSPAPDPVSQSDAEFLAYLQRSLEVISSKADRSELSAGTTVGQLPTGVVTPPMLPPLGAGGTVGSLGTGPVNVIERVYIPYQTTQPTVTGAPVVVPQPGGIPPAIAPSATAIPTAPSAPDATPIHTLVGILELGDRSAALFEISGVSQRVYIGERVGSSGWSLVSVSNQEAMIRRNGEVRSIYIGQRF